jgi:hypothetical protein
VKSAEEVLEAFDNVRRAQRAGVYAPHKPLLILLALARVQQGAPRQTEFGAVDAPLRSLLAEFGPSSAAKSRHYPFWHLATDGNGALWELSGPRAILDRPAGATPNLKELRTHDIRAGFPVEIDQALRQIPGLLEAVAARVLETQFPATLHADIAAAVGLSLDRPPSTRPSPSPSATAPPSAADAIPPSASGCSGPMSSAVVSLDSTCASDRSPPASRLRTSNGITLAARTLSRMGWRSAPSTTSCSIWELSLSSRPNIASCSASTQFRATAVRKASFVTMDSDCWHRKNATCVRRQTT